MDAAKIRVWSLSGANEPIKKLLISDQGKQIFDFVKKQTSATSAEVGREFGLSVQHASIVLNRLWCQGYLSRKQSAHESGGQVYVYSVLDSLGVQP